VLLHRVFKDYANHNRDSSLFKFTKEGIGCAMEYIDMACTQLEKENATWTIQRFSAHASDVDIITHFKGVQAIYPRVKSGAYLRIQETDGMLHATMLTVKPLNTGKKLLNGFTAPQLVRGLCPDMADPNLDIPPAPKRKKHKGKHQEKRIENADCTRLRLHHEKMMSQLPVMLGGVETVSEMRYPFDYHSSDSDAAIKLMYSYQTGLPFDGGHKFRSVFHVLNLIRFFTYRMQKYAEDDFKAACYKHIQFEPYKEDDERVTFNPKLTENLTTSAKAYRPRAGIRSSGLHVANPLFFISLICVLMTAV
jgi:hypothetical protein